MTAVEAIQEARRRGLVLTQGEGGKLRYHGPEGSLSEDLKRELKRHKPEILALLVEGPSTHPCSRCERFVFVEPNIVCYWCRRAEEVPHEA